LLHCHYQKFLRAAFPTIQAVEHGMGAIPRSSAKTDMLLYSLDQYSRERVPKYLVREPALCVYSTLLEAIQSHIQHLVPKRLRNSVVAASGGVLHIVLAQFVSGIVLHRVPVPKRIGISGWMKSQRWQQRKALQTITPRRGCHLRSIGQRLLTRTRSASSLVSRVAVFVWGGLVAREKSS
jgi:hypothetical protein